MIRIFAWALLLCCFGPALLATPAPYHVTWYDLEVQLHAGHRRIAGTQEIYLRATQDQDRIAVLMGSQLEVAQLRVDQHPAEYQRQGDTLWVMRPLRAGTASTVKIIYAGPVESPETVWAEGQVRLEARGLPAHHWWPHGWGACDSLRLSVISPQEDLLLCSGTLVDLETRPGRYLRRSYRVPYPTVPDQLYLLVGAFTRVVANYAGKSGSVQLRYVAPVEHSSAGRRELQRIQQGLAWLEERLGPFPFPEQGLTWVKPAWTPTRNASDPTRALDPALLVGLAQPWLGRHVAPGDSLAEALLLGLRQHLPMQYLRQSQGRQAAWQYLVDTHPTPWGAGLLHVVEQVAERPGEAQDLIRALLAAFAGKQPTGQALIDFVDEAWAVDVSPLVLQYLLYRETPRLEYEFDRRGRRTLLRYRWQSAVSDLAMPVWFWVDDELRRLEATTEWQTLEERGVARRQIRPEPQKGWYQREKP
jgi:hypothetical protein